MTDGDIKDTAAATTLEAPVESLPIPRVGSTTAVINDMIYMFSGRGGISMMPVEENGAVWRYTPSQSLWELIGPDTTGPYPLGRSYHAMTSDGSENIYIHAGCPEQGRLSDLWSFNIKSKTWAELPAAPSAPRGGTSIAFHRGKLYRMNGFDGETEQGGALDIYDVDGHSWSTISFQPDGIQGPGPRSVSALLAAQVEGKDYIFTLFGERDPSSLGHAGAGKMLGDVWAFDLESQKWSEIKTAGVGPAPRGWFDADVMQDQSGKQALIVHGGLAEDNSRLGDVWKLEFA